MPLPSVPETSKPLSDNNSDWQWAGLAKRDGVHEDRWMAFLQTQPRLLITRQEVPMERQALKYSSLSSVSQRHGSWWLNWEIQIVKLSECQNIWFKYCGSDSNVRLARVERKQSCSHYAVISPHSLQSPRVSVVLFAYFTKEYIKEIWLLSVSKGSSYSKVMYLHYTVARYQRQTVAIIKAILLI